jgi:hypothetical protein
MRLLSLFATVLILLTSDLLPAQEWIDYTSRTDFFHVNFPGQPKVQDITYQTEYGITLPGHAYRVENGPNRYSVTVVNYADAEKIPQNPLSVRRMGEKATLATMPGEVTCKDRSFTPRGSSSRGTPRSRTTPGMCRTSSKGIDSN